MAPTKTRSEPRCDIEAGGGGTRRTDVEVIFLAGNIRIDISTVTSHIVINFSITTKNKIKN